MRNFGITTVRTALGGGEQPSARYSADTRADSNVYFLPPSPSAFILPPPEDDRELSALIFAGLVAGPLLVTSIVLFYLAF